ncbi:MAG TPA: AtpZ/AtpI family protein [Nevskiaceae bacterium]|nr:AtpZ/AtpI family protein [Nevskiaceae bacterium]
MKPAADHTTTKSPVGQAPFTAGIVGMTFLDTTWRMATPVILFTVLGLLADRQLGSKPWLTLLAVLIGFVFAALLVKRQIEAIDKKEERK